MVFTNKRRLQYLSWLTLLGMSAIGIVLIHYLQQKGVRDTMLGGKKYYLQLLAGLFFGSLAALLGVLLVNGRRFRSLRTFFEDMIGEINPSLFDILFYSFCASVGEEVLFRAGVQPLIGIWPTAVLFVLLHGYINPANINLTIYGLFLVAISAGFGYLFKFFGLFSAMVAHFVYDVSMFCVLKYAYRRNMEAGTAV
ncbi:MAG: CPBP family intramembrane metalloprotease [Chitinophagales bacterium]|nr:CPBP family intramembrane metalloprotease [Chitinophagales bacterium]